jgi:hypothetical protein
VTASRIDLAPALSALVVPGRPAVARPQLWLNSPAVVLSPAAADGPPADGRVTEENVDKLEDGDSAISSGLEELAQNLETVAADGESRAAETLIKVRQVLEDFG